MVTGAASGIGAATARALTAAGARVAVADINAPGAEEVAAALRQDGVEAIGIGVDVADEQQVSAAVDRTVNELGSIDILHNNAAITSPEHQNRDWAIHELDVEVWDRTMAVNLRGCMLCAKHAIPHMIERGGGVIINTTSGLGILAEGVRSAYGTSKAGIIGFTRNVATQYGKQNIRCVAISPGLTLTPGMKANMPPEVIEMLLRHHLTPRLGEPDDLANAVVFLASDRASFITGVTLNVDGGLTSHSPAWADETAMMAAAAQS
jgi:NAD(P)-dependent dehydrogenase (short-subunit alcohol dehydrogenase family)